MVTLYRKQSDGTYSRHVVRDVQWSDQTRISNINGIVGILKSSNVTFFEGTYEDLDLQSLTEEDVIFRGEIDELVIDGRISALLRSHPISGTVESVNDNSNRQFLKNIKVVLAR